MKKFIISLAVIGLIFAGTSDVAKAENEPCATVSVTCPNGVQFTALICNSGDWHFYMQHYCGMAMD